MRSWVSQARLGIPLEIMALSLLIASTESWGGGGQQVYGARGAWELSHLCPPSFEKLDDGTCAFRSLYQLYSAPALHGGMRVPLPSHRDGFTPEQIDLGRYLFFDPVLSADHSMSCATCHQPSHGFSDGRATSMGHGATLMANGQRDGGTLLTRAAPTLWNVGFLQRFFWDGRAMSLEEQALGPLFSDAEMATDSATLTQALNSSETYRSLFAAAFKRLSTRAITVTEITKALAAFETSLVSFGSRYDRYAHGQEGALNTTEVAGLNIFRGFVARCSQCHVPPLFTDGEIVVVGAPPAADGSVDGGAGALDGDGALVGGFKIPTLRNVALTAPYFNAGQFATLQDVVEFYNGGRGHAVPSGTKEMIHWHISMPKGTLSEREVEELVAFMGTLTDETMMPGIPRALPSGLAPVQH